MPSFSLPPIKILRSHHIRAVALLSLTTLSAVANASGDYGPPISRFVANDGSDVDPARLEEGRMGVVQTGWPRLRLYAAWRAIALDARGLSGPVLPAGTLTGIVRATGNPNAPCAGDVCLVAWRQAAGAVMQRAGRDTVTGRRITVDYTDYVECPGTTFDTAARTLVGLRARLDANDGLLREWVDGQDAVFSNCDLPTPIPMAWQNDTFRLNLIRRHPTPHIPAPLPASVPAFWREQRDYQIAAALFHAGRLDEANRAFQVIAVNPHHGMHDWGSYLALRAKLRMALEAHVEDADSPASAQALGQLEESAAAIFADGSLSKLHEATRATLRRARARLTPITYFRSLTQHLEDPTQVPTTEDRLGDWRALGSTLLDNDYANERVRLRVASAMLDWMLTVQACIAPGDLPFTGAGRPSAKELLAFPRTPDKSNVPAACKGSADHALERWHAALDVSDKAAARPWLLAFLLTTNAAQADAVDEALKTSPKAPEYLTLLAQLARVARLSDDFAGESAFATAGLDAIADAPEEREARNVFMRARFDGATDFSAASDALERPISQLTYQASGEVSPSGPGAIGIDEDGAGWLDSRLAAEDLLTVSANPRIAHSDRGRIAVSAWLRADFTGQSMLAKRAAQAAGNLVPALLPLVDRYVKAPTATVQHHVLLSGILQFGLAPDFQQQWWQRVEFVANPHPESVVASAWCRIATPDFMRADTVAPLMAAKDLNLPGGQSSQRAAAEIARLRALPSATGMIGRDAIAWAHRYPNDPDVPWLLYVTVQSTRGGCLEKNVHALSVDAFRLLHSRYPTNPWTGRTPYSY